MPPRSSIKDTLRAHGSQVPVLGIVLRYKKPFSVVGGTQIEKEKNRRQLACLHRAFMQELSPTTPYVYYVTGNVSNGAYKPSYRSSRTAPEYSKELPHELRQPGLVAPSSTEHLGKIFNIIKLELEPLANCAARTILFLDIPSYNGIWPRKMLELHSYTPTPYAETLAKQTVGNKVYDCVWVGDDRLRLDRLRFTSTAGTDAWSTEAAEDGMIYDFEKFKSATPRQHHLQLVADKKVVMGRIEQRLMAMQETLEQALTASNTRIDALVAQVTHLEGQVVAALAKSASGHNVQHDQSF